MKKALIIIIIAGIICCGAVFRNLQVFSYRVNLIHNISKASMAEINKGLPYSNWRFQEFDTVSYNKQVLMFWKSLDSFYENMGLFQEIQQIKKGGEIK